MRNHYLLQTMPAFFMLAATLLLTWFAYAPGLSGSFLFDDFANLPILGEMGTINNWPAFWRYITAGHADPTGRPLALLSFLIDARDWPAQPYPFIRTNIVLHLVNGTLLALLLIRLGRLLLPPATRLSQAMRTTLRTDLAALLGAALWMLHPLFVSTTLYIVQREAMLPATFTLLGLLLWLHGRHQLQTDRRLSGQIWIALGLGGCTLLGVLSKANGILLPALALLIETILLAPRSPMRHPHTYRWMMRLFAWLPTGLLAGYLLYQGWTGITSGISSIRPWTLGQRLLTEPRVLIDYLDLLWRPRPFTPGLFNDHVQASTSLWSPATTLPSLLAIVGLIAGAWWLRRRTPVLALAVLFYFVGHALESSTIALELHFEHRNYLPAALMFWPLALWLCSAWSSTQGVTPKLSLWAKGTFAAILVLGLGLMTHSRAELWGNSHDQAMLWAELNPDSARAQAHAAHAEMMAGYPDRALIRLRKSLARNPGEVQLALNLVSAECQSGRVDSATLAEAANALSTTRKIGGLLPSWFGRAIEQTRQPSCPELHLDTLESLVVAAQTNPYLDKRPGRRQDMHFILGRIALARDKPGEALSHFNRALDQQVRIGLALEQSALLGSAGYPRRGLAHLDHYQSLEADEYQPADGMPRLHAFVLQRQQYWNNELTHLRATLKHDVEAKMPVHR